MRSHRGDLRRLRDPLEFIGAWWRAAERAPSKVASDYYRFQLLTGCRGVEICGHKLHEYPPIRVGDVDHRAGTGCSRAREVRTRRTAPRVLRLGDAGAPAVNTGR
jgi:hypothetical protein